MDYSKKKITNYFLYDTPVENLFLGEYMLDAPGDYVKVYLLALMHAQIGEPVDSLSLAKQLSLSAETVDKAWLYWEERGVARRIAKDVLSDAYTVEITNLKEVIFGHCAVETQVHAPAPAKIDLSDKELAKLLQDIQDITGRLLESREPEAVAGWVKDFDIAPDVIRYCYQYSTNKGKSNRYRYVEKILFDWKDRNLNSAREVEEYLGAIDKQYETYKRVLKELGQNRNPSEPEKRMMDRWFTDFGFSLNDVLSACSSTTAAANPSIKYLDSVLASRYREKHSDATEVPVNTYSRIQALYEKTREENAAKTEQKRKEIFAQVPQLEDVFSEIKECGIKLTMLMLSGNAAETEKLRRRQEYLEEQKKSLLKKAGFGEDALEPVFTCRKCQDMGFLENGTACSCYADKLRLLK